MAVMNFGDPQYLWLLLGVPLLALLARRARRRRGRDWRILEQRGAAPGDRSLVVILALVLIALALARPRIGRAVEGPAGPGRDVVLVFDVSRSMGAEDAAPNRLGLAVETAASLIRVLAREPADRAAVVAFAGRGVPRCPLTQNFGAALDAMNRLRPGDVRPGGTNLGAALDAVADAFDPEQSTEGGTVVLFSDGEDHHQRWEKPLERLIRMGVTVHAVGLGDAEKGWPVPSGESGQPLKHQGESVTSKRVDEALAAIAERSGGAYLKLGVATTDLGPLFRDRIAPVADAKRRAARGGDRPERFPLFLGAALGFLAVGFWPWRFSLERAAGLALLGAVAAAQRGASAAQPAPERETPAEAVDRGRLAYDQGRFDEALDAFGRAAAIAPGRAVPRYNVAATLYQLGRYAEAMESYQLARENADKALRVKIDYGLGNASIRLGDFAGAARHYDDCLSSTARGDQLDAVRADAAINRRFALERLRDELSQSGELDELSNSNDPDQPKAPPRSSDAHEDDEPGEGPSDRPPDDSDVEEAEAAASPSPRKSGGAGGSGRTPNPSVDRPPGDRLDSALERIRDAKRRRLPDQPPPEESQPDVKDW